MVFIKVRVGHHIPKRFKLFEDEIGLCNNLFFSAMTIKKAPVHDLTPEQLEKYFIPLIPKNKRGFASSISPFFIFRCIQHKLKTGCQWKHLFLDYEGIIYPCPAQSVYYFCNRWLYNRWRKFGVFERAYQALLRDKASEIAPTELNLDGTQSPAKKGARPWRIKAEKRLARATAFM